MGSIRVKVVEVAICTLGNAATTRSDGKRGMDISSAVFWGPCSRGRSVIVGHASRTQLIRASTYEGKSRGSESGGASDGRSTRLLGVFAGDELGNAIGDELRARKG